MVFKFNYNIPMSFTNSLIVNKPFNILIMLCYCCRTFGGKVASIIFKNKDQHSLIVSDKRYTKRITTKR